VTPRSNRRGPSKASHSTLLEGGENNLVKSEQNYYTRWESIPTARFAWHALRGAEKYGRVLLRSFVFGWLLSCWVFRVVEATSLRVLDKPELGTEKRSLLSGVSQPCLFYRITGFFALPRGSVFARFFVFCFFCWSGFSYAPFPRFDSLLLGGPRCTQAGTTGPTQWIPWPQSLCGTTGPCLPAPVRSCVRQSLLIWRCFMVVVGCNCRV